jgi:hypothetical protein
MADGIVLNNGTGGKELETTQLANGRQVQALEVVTIDEDGLAIPISADNPLPCVLITE